MYNKFFLSYFRPSDIIAQSMAALQELLEHGFVSWDQSVNQRFLDKVSSSSAWQN